MSTLSITETVLRDGNQSLAATRMPIDEMIPALEDMNKVGYGSIECWGGATFDACLRYLNEDPWERLRIFRNALGNVKLQMLMRSQCILGYKHYPDDLVRKFVEEACKNGIDIIRVFDALNDVENMKVSVDEIIKNGKEASCTLSYSKSPIHNLKDYVSLARKFEKMGASSITIKDMSGILSPMESYELISRLKDKIDLPIILHSHCTGDFAYLSYYEAIRAGVDAVDTCISPFSGGTSQPSTELVIQMAKELGREVEIDEEALDRVGLHFKGVRERMEKEGKISFRSTIPNPKIIHTQIPGGMYSNLLTQLKNLGLEDKIDEVIEEVPRVRRDLGYPPLVTPISQMLGVQAVTNIALNGPYENIIKEVQDYLEGKYGRPPGQVNLDLLKRVTGKEKMSKRRYAQTLRPVFEETKEFYKAYQYSDEEIISLLLFPEPAKKFLDKKYLVDDEDIWDDEEPRKIPLPKEIPDFTEGDQDQGQDKDTIIRSALPGNVVKVCIENNQKVKKGQVLMVIETMKMENEIISDFDCLISNTFVKPGVKILKGDSLLEYVMGQ